MAPDPRPDEHTVRPNDDPIARHVQQAGSPPPIDEGRFQALRPNLEAAWRVASAMRRRRRRRERLALAAMVLVVVGAAWWMSRSNAPSRASVAAATVLAVDGTAVDREPILVGVVIDSGRGRLALRTVDGHQLRLDRATRLVPESGQRWRLDAGAVHVDARAAPLELVTHWGTVEHLGTRYLVRSTIDGVITQVREGRIRWQGQGTVEVGRGEGVAADAVGTRIVVVAPDDDSWDWVAEAAPPFVADGRSVVEILEHLAAENGWRLEIDPAILGGSDAIRFHGSIDGFESMAAVEWVARTAGWQAQLNGSTLFLSGSTSDSESER
ncbi:MAG: FecR domain-containing protein [Acidobacteriota bacterium]